MGGLDGHVALVTGAAAGIGRATAAALVREGAAVAVVDVDAAGGRDAAAELERGGGRAAAFAADLADGARAVSVFAEVVAALGAVHVLVNCAGIHPLDSATLTELDDATWDHVNAVNLRAPFLLTRAVAKHVRARGGGRIVNLISIGAFRAGAKSAYTSTKAGLIGLTRSAAGELAAHGVNANAVAPGLERTPVALAVFGSDAELDARAAGANPFGRASEAADVAAVIVFLCLPASKDITAQVIDTSAGAVVA